VTNSAAAGGEEVLAGLLEAGSSARGL